MSLRTYPLITHPAFISFVEYQLGRDAGLHKLPASQTPVHLPSIHAIHEVADYLRVSPFLLRSMLRKPERHYRAFSFNKRAGGKRWIHSPRTFLKVTQWWILDTILANCPTSECAHGFVTGRSFVTNARAHFGASHVVNFDVADFFPSLRSKLVSDLFEGLGYSKEVSGDLSRLTTLNDTLPQGAPTSPAISNLLLKDVDSELLQLSEQLGLKYTRYADDMTFSSTSRIGTELQRSVAECLAKVGLKLNVSKTRYMGPNERKEVTGLVLGLNDVRLAPEFLNACRGWFHTSARDPKTSQHQIDRIRGTVALIEHVKGAGSAKVAELGRKALHTIEQHQGRAESYLENRAADQQAVDATSSIVQPESQESSTKHKAETTFTRAVRTIQRRFLNAIGSKD